MKYTENLRAGVPQRLGYLGRFFMIVDAGNAGAVDVRAWLSGSQVEDYEDAGRGFKLRVLVGGFHAVELTAAVDTQAVFVVSDNDVDIDLFDGATVNVTATTPLPVSNDRGTPGNLLHVSGVTLADAPATSATASAPVACSAVTAVIKAANANRRALRFLNLGPDPVAITPPAGTWAQRVIVLDVGDVWTEDRAGNLAWSGICDAAKTASVTVQEVLA